MRYKKVFTLVMVLLLSLMCTSSVFATNVEGGVSNPNTTENKLDGSGLAKDEATNNNISDTIQNIFLNDAFNNGNDIATGLAMAAPFARLSRIIAVGVLAVASYWFVSQTSVDVFAIVVPMCRGFLVGRTEQHGAASGGFGMAGAGNKGKFLCLSESAMEALGYSGSGSSGGGLGGERESSIKMCIAKYAGLRTLEFSVLVLFVVVFFTPVLGYVVGVLGELIRMFLIGFVTMFQ